MLPPNIVEVWHNMEQEMTALMLDTRSKRLNRLWQATLEKRGKILNASLQGIAKHPDVEWAVPNAADLYQQSETFRNILLTPLAEDEKDTLTRASFKVAFRSLKSISGTWERDKRAALLSLLPEHDLEDESSTVDRLALATSMFRCARCDKNSYSELGGRSRCYHSSNLLAHQCCYSRRYRWEYTPASNDAERVEEVNERLLSYPWLGGAETYCFDPVAAGRARELIEMAELDPSTATVAEMDNLDERFVCVCPTCEEAKEDNDGVMVAFSWRQAVCCVCYGIGESSLSHSDV